MNRWGMLALLLVMGCVRSPGAQDLVPADAPSIDGTIRRVTPRPEGPVLLVEQVPTRSAGEPIASVRVTPATRVLAAGPGGIASAPAAPLGVGTRVQVWFVGPVAESYPVQATAGTILVLAEPDGS